MIHLILSLICVCVFLTIAAGMTQVCRDLISGHGAVGRHGPSGLSQADKTTLPDTTEDEQMVGTRYQHTETLLTFNLER